MSSNTQVLFLGSPHWCRHLSDMFAGCAGIQAYTSSQWLRWLRRRPRTICLVGLGPADSWKRWLLHAFARACFYLGISSRPMMYWIGSDILRLTPDRAEVARSRNLAGSDWLAEEVKANGYECSARLFPVEADGGPIVPLPATQRLQVLCYVPDQANVLHGGPEIMAAAARCSQVDFTVVGGTGYWCSDAPENVRFLGWVDDLTPLIASSHIVLRRTQHDSLSALVREALLAGRHVFFTYPVAGAVLIESGDTDGLVNNLREKAQALEAGELSINALPQGMRDLLSDSATQTALLADALR